MYINKITLINFRNYKEAYFEPHKQMNLILGDNAQGKSNFLEALFLFTTGKSFRAQREIELIRWDEAFARIILEILYKHNERIKLEILIEAQKRNNYVSKIIKINNNRARAATNLVGTLNAVLFSPDDLEIIKGPPSARRRFLDLQITQISPVYCNNLRNYYKVLEQRNSLLRSSESRKEKFSLLDIWDEELIRYGSPIIIQRLKNLKRLNDLTCPILSDISNGREEIKLKYLSPVTIEGKKLDEFFLEKEKELEEYLGKNLKKYLYTQRDHDLKKGATITGPHRDDLQILINNKPLKNFGSQGQQRSVALSLKLAERELMNELTGEEPVLLLDDITSELDRKRCIKLLNFLKGKGQIFITQSQKMDYLEPLYREASFVHITEGMLKIGIFD